MRKKLKRGVSALAECKICWLMNSKQLPVLFEDEEVEVVLADKPSAGGHVIVLPKEHYPIIEQVPDPLLARLGILANKISIAVFEVLGAQGTNILINNGVSGGQQHAHFMINIIPRREGDGLDFSWKPLKIDEDKMSDIQSKVKSHLIVPEQEPEPKASLEETEDELTTISDDEEENYLLKHLRRVP